MRDAGQLVFVEVRYRRRKDFGGAAASVDSAKQRKLRAAAQYYLQQHDGGESCPCRFDVVTFSGTGTPAQADWIKDAF
jgi:putative endonuclease